MSQVPTLVSWISTFGSRVMPNRSLAESPVTRPVGRPSGRAARPGGSIRPSTRSGVSRSVTSTRASIAAAAVTIVRPAQVLQPALGGQLRGDLDEHLRLQLGQVRQRAAHPAGRVVLGQPVRREHVREDLGSCSLAAGSGCSRLSGARVHLAGRVGLLAVERVAHRRLVRLVVRRQRPVEQPGRRVQPALAVGLHDERVVAGEPVRPAGALSAAGTTAAWSTRSPGTSWPVHSPCSSSHQT